MNKSRFKLTLLVFALAQQSVLWGGSANPTDRKSFSASLKNIQRFKTGVMDEVLNRKLNGRKRLDLITSSEENKYMPPAPIETGLPQTYKQIRELISSLEDDYYKVKGGDSGASKGLRLKCKELESQIGALRKGLGFGNAPRQFKRKKSSKPSTSS